MGNILNQDEEYIEEIEENGITNPNHHVIIRKPQAMTTSPSNSIWNDYPLHLAASSGAQPSELNRLVVHEGHDVDGLDPSGSTPLHLAAYYGQETCVRWLLNKGQARYIKDYDGNTPADNARQCGFLEIAELIESAMNSTNFHTTTIRRNRKEGFKVKEEALYLELDRAQSKIASLKASEKRARIELEQEASERVKLFRTLVGADATRDNLNALDSLTDLRMQVIEFKAQRDSLAAELKLVEDAILDFEIFITGERPKTTNSLNNNENDYVSPSARLRACLRKV